MESVFGYAHWSSSGIPYTTATSEIRVVSRQTLPKAYDSLFSIGYGTSFLCMVSRTKYVLHLKNLLRKY